MENNKNSWNPVQISPCGINIAPIKAMYQKTELFGKTTISLRKMSDIDREEIRKKITNGEISSLKTLYVKSEKGILCHLQIFN